MEEEIIEGLKRAVVEYNSEDAANWAKRAIEQEIDPLTVLDALTQAIRKVGDGFANCELWLPDLIGAADAMQAVMPILEEEIKRRGAERETLGKVVSGTVYGDIHNIGKDMVNTLLTAEGFEVIDLGINVSPEMFVEAVEKHSPNILAMSALMTMTAPEMINVITVLTQKGLRDKVKIMIGGGAITEEFANSIGADGYDPTAPGAVILAKRFVSKD